MNRPLKNCPNDNILADYAAGGLPRDEINSLERHISGCKACLQKISIALKAEALHKEGGLTGPAPETIQKALKRLGLGNTKNTNAGFIKTKKRQFWFLAAMAAFVLSFVFPKYFLQCLVMTILLGLKWIMESENMRTLILVIDSWRRHQHNQDEEIIKRLTDRNTKGIPE